LHINETGSFRLDFDPAESAAARRASQ
jgi:hypothetical protein